MFVWRKRASLAWLAANEAALTEIAGQRLAIISKPADKHATAEVAASSRAELKEIGRRFGGRIEKLPRDWLNKFLRGQKSKPLNIGKRLVIVSSSKSKSKSLVIPAGAAFGTGEHATTIMSLRMLERLTRFRGAQAASPNYVGPSASCRRSQGSSLRSPDKGFSLIDLGTGSGILALAAKKFQAGKVIALDHDPIAIAIARENARRNRIENVDFRVADVRRWKFPPCVDIITANLFSELLVEIVPKLKCARWLILSGVLRQEEGRLLGALKANRIAVVKTLRRGKWIALVAQPIQPSSRAQAEGSRGGTCKVIWRDLSTAL